MHPDNPINNFLYFKDTDIEQSIIDRFHQQVQLYPGRIALRDGQTELTYEALNKLANSIASYLLETNLRPGSRVGILMEHGIPFIAAILGVLKGGCAYLPLDPRNTRQRILYQLQDAEAVQLLVDSHNQSFSECVCNADFEIGVFEEICSKPSASEVKLSIDPAALACILYTSGSSGKPKGVGELHRNVLNNIRNYTNVARISWLDVHTLFHICSFGASRLDIFGALLNGATLSLYDLRKNSFSDVLKAMRDHRVTVFHSTPTVFRHMLALSTGKQDCASIRLLHLGSESVTKLEYGLYRKYLPDHCRFLNRYGTTETGTISLNLLDKNVKVDGQLVPSGFPVDNLELRLVDGDGKPVIDGEPGEVVVCSRFLSPGYWNQPHLPSKAFKSDDASGLCSYKTGDMGRLDKSGMLTLLGRNDNQVKIRGFRVEISEVELALESLDLVRNAIVTAWQDHETELIAYIVPSVLSDKTIESIRKELSGALPDYMQPYDYVCLDAIPVTANGKLDRHKLPLYHRKQELPETSEDDSQASKLRELWGRILGVTEFDENDSFFSLGGDSLRALKITSGIKSQLGVSISLPEFLEAESLVGLIRLVKKGN